MKTHLTLLLAVCLPLALPAADQLNPELQRGLFEEEANQNFTAAIKAYQGVLTAHDSERKLAATALFRLGECYRKLGQTNDAVTQFQRLVAEFPEQATLANLSRQNLVGLGVKPTGGNAQDPDGKDQVIPQQRAIAAQFAEAAQLDSLVKQLQKLSSTELRTTLATVAPDAVLDGLLLQQAREEQNRSSISAKFAPGHPEVKEVQARLVALNEQIDQRVSGILRGLKMKAEGLARQVEVLKSEPAIAGGTMPAGGPLSPEAEELARTERLLAQLRGWDLSQLRRLIPSLIPDAQFAQKEKELLAAQESLRNYEVTAKGQFGFGTERDRFRKQIAQVTEELANRANEIIQHLENRVAKMREIVGRQPRQFAAPASATVAAESAAPTDEEEKEIRRIQALIKDSPDLINALNVEVAKVRSGELMVPKNGTLLHRAANQGQLDVARFLIDHGADVGARDEMGRTPLHRAAGNGHRAMVELLLANKADANAKVSQYPDNGSTSLHLAVGKGYRTVCETLLARGADPNLGDASGTPPIYPAVWADDAATVRLLLARGARVNPAPGKNGYTPLHSAKSTNVATMLIEAGAVVDALNDSNQSPLHYCAGEGKTDVVAVLLAAGANPNLKDKDGKTPLFRAAASWKADVVAPLISKGANPNERNVYGGVPLDELIQFIPLSGFNRQEVNRSSQLETLQAFLAGGADPNLIIAGGSPHLFRAVSEGLEEQAEALLKAGADPNARSDYDREGTSNLKGQTPLIRALRGTKLHSSGPGYERTRTMSMVNLLLEHKADVNLADGNGDTPLYFAITADAKGELTVKVPLVEALLKRGASVEAQNSEGNTPLVVAIGRGMKDVVDLLLKYKADPNAKTQSGATPLHWAGSERNLDILDSLLAAGANPNLLDAYGKSPLDYLKSAGSQRGSSGFASLPGRPLTPPPSVSVQMAGGLTQSKLVADQAALAERLRQAGARDWAPRPGLITVTRRSTGASQVIFTKGTNDWNRHSLLEVMGFTFFGSGTSFPFPDFSKLTITRLDLAKGGVREFTIDLPAALAANDCQADQWLEWGDLIDIPEGEHKLDEKWAGLPHEFLQSMTKCLARKVTLTVKGQLKEVPLVAGSWRGEYGANGVLRNYPDRLFLLRPIVLGSGQLLTSSDTTRVKVTRPDATNGSREWTFDLTKEPSAGNDLWLRDGDLIEVPEKQ